jgi:hypothetical protein
MLLFGYIISDVKYNDMKDDVIKVVNSEDDCVVSVPKLVIGLDKAKEYANNHGFVFDILNHEYPNGDMWTFKKTEKRELYEVDIIKFKEKIIKLISDDVTYYYINVYNLRYSKAKKLYLMLFRDLYSRDVNYIFIDKGMMYFPLQGKNVIGISFNILKYINIDREKVIDKCRKGICNKVIFSNNKKLWQLMSWFKGKEYVIPSLLMNNIHQ